MERAISQRALNSRRLDSKGWGGVAALKHQGKDSVVEDAARRGAVRPCRKRALPHVARFCRRCDEGRDRVGLCGRNSRCMIFGS